jgi:hypothetical protein
MRFNLGFPIDITKAIIGTLTVRIPWTKIWKEPLTIIIKDVFIIGKTKSDYDLKYHELREKLMKQSLLDEMNRYLFEKLSSHNFQHQEVYLPF